MSQASIFSAPTPLILSGDYGLSYSRPALGVALNWRVTFTVFPSRKTVSDERVGHMTETVKRKLKTANIVYRNRKFAYKTAATTPQGRGLGTSVAKTVSAAAALLHFFSGRRFEPELVNEVAYRVEKHFGSRSTGFLNTISALGGLVYYRREFEFLKGIYHLSMKIPQTIEDRLFLLDTGQLGGTASDITTKISILYKKKPLTAENIFNRIEKTTKRIVVALASENPVFFKESLALEQQLLQRLGVVSSPTRELIRELISCAIAKVSGSGWLLCYVEKENEFKKIVSKHHLPFYKLHQSVAGVMQEIAKP